jgi:hypothetical protein
VNALNGREIHVWRNHNAMRACSYSSSRMGPISLHSTNNALNNDLLENEKQLEERDKVAVKGDRHRTVAEMTGDPLAPAQVGVEIKKRS